jgi:hypothetical protein
MCTVFQPISSLSSFLACGLAIVSLSLKPQDLLHGAPSFVFAVAILLPTMAGKKIAKALTIRNVGLCKSLTVNAVNFLKLGNG